MPSANLVEQEDKETLLEVSLYASGCSKFKGNESSALSLLNKLRFEGEAGFCDVTLRVKRKQLTSLAFWRQTVNSLTMFSCGMKDSNQKVFNL